MDQPERINDETLLDFLLERCDEAEAARIAAVLQQDEEQATRFERLAGTLKPLESWTAPEPRAGMVDDILDAIAAQEPVKFVPAASTLPSGSDRPSRGSPIISLRELVALAACITIFVGVFVPALNKARFNSRRHRCANNLGSLFRGTSSYATANAGLLPFAGQAPGRPWLGKEGRPRASNRRHLLPAARGRYFRLRILICPAREGDTPMDPADLASCDDFPSGDNCSYDLQHMAGPTPRQLARVARLRLTFLSDANPLFDGARFHADVDPERANSTSHGGVGQNVVHFDGSTAWYDSPQRGPTGDNIWQAGARRHYEGTEEPASATDAFLIP
ncbi:MAG: hypothetical protein ACYSUI_11875 [Planctomycetota bacterium]|jgi:hypothetical protein